ncbi:MAG: hypothetical protein JXR51_10400 [Bacteroidales bacterium]|nr:hypothetical protein [Bacteroidales bacterium]MBN2757576.1 hypothetical protein [Bacteroidales bacterium]
MKFSAFLIIMLSAFFISIANAQTVNYSEEDDDYVQFVENNSTNENYAPIKENKSKISYNVNMGTSYGTGFYGNSLSFYTAPKVNYNFSSKFSISAGVIFINSTISSLQEEKKANVNQAYLYNSFNYLASERLKISGEILYGMNKSPYDVTNQTKNQDYYLRFNAEYQITKNISVGIQLIKSNNNYYNPFAVPSYNPFYNDTFSNSFSPFGGF